MEPSHRDSSSGSALMLDSTLQELHLCYYSVDVHTHGGEIAHAFERLSHLPGVVLLYQQKFLGMISRQRFWQHMSRPYSLELFLNRPIASLYHMIHREVLCLPDSTSIVEAARLLLCRDPDLLDEPLVVACSDGQHGLLGAHQLLIAAAQIHQLTTKLLQESTHQLKIANWELQRLAELDGLTGIANRRRFDEYLPQVLAHAYQLQQPMTLLLTDVDFFKRYNDRYGHLIGDQCLRQIAQCLQQQVHEPGCLVSRYGGEEFSILLPGFDQDRAIAFIHDLRAELHQLSILHEDSLISDRITLSIGGVHLTPEALTLPERVIDQADQALYEAKKQGRNCYVLENGAEQSRTAVQTGY